MTNTTSTASLTTIDELDALIGRMEAVRDEAAGDDYFGMDDDWPLFIRHMRMLTPQSASPRILNYLAGEHGLRAVPACEDRGNVRDHDLEHWAMKVTVVTSTNPGTNFVQLRPYQDLAGYQLFVVDQDYRVWHFQLTAKEMERELGPAPAMAHGNDTTRKVNPRSEYAIRFEWDPTSGRTKDWIEKYAVHHCCRYLNER